VLAAAGALTEDHGREQAHQPVQRSVGVGHGERQLAVGAVVPDTLLKVAATGFLV
jgi:hypothetical protein